jgi:hypothetical protein
MMEVGGNERRLGTWPVFHFSSLPTVTAGYDGFAFDIRELFKVAGVENRYAGRSFGVRGWDIYDGNHGQQV